MAGNTSTPGATRDLARAGAARRLRRAPPPAHPDRARPSAPDCRCPPRTGWSASWSRGARWCARRPGEYVVGRRLWDLGLLAPVQTGLRELASPFLHDLYGATLATVHLAVRDGTEVLYLDRLAGHASVPVVSSGRLPAAAARTGVGKVLLAHAPADVAAGGARRPDPGHAVHDHPAGTAARGSSRGCCATATPRPSRR